MSPPQQFSASEKWQQTESLTSSFIAQDYITSIKDSYRGRRFLPLSSGDEGNRDVHGELNKERTPNFELREIPPLAQWISEQEPPQSRFVSLQKWECAVSEVMEESFYAILHDLTEKGTEEQAEFPLEEVSEEDKELVKPGAIFYWNIGYHDSINGQRTRVSLIRFRRLPAWTEKDIEASHREAIHTRDVIGWK